ncbi:hypothetical protein SAMN05518866_13350 [Sphingobium sp. YR768]|nr:hypothetical protein SAMN05518866_13350 [Sphingobium sp. YR768]
MAQHQREDGAETIFWEVAEGVEAAAVQPVRVELGQRPSAAETPRPAAVARVGEVLSPETRLIETVVGRVEDLASRSLIWTTFAVTNENKHRRAPGNDHSANPLRRSDQTIAGGFSS